MCANPVSNVSSYRWSLDHSRIDVYSTWDRMGGPAMDFQTGLVLDWSSIGKWVELCRHIGRLGQIRAGLAPYCRLIIMGRHRIVIGSDWIATWSPFDWHSIGTRLVRMDWL